MKKSKYLNLALHAVEEAEKIIKEYQNTDKKVNIKKDNSPATIADLEAEKTIKEIISNEFPEHNFLGEETGVTKQEGKYTWVIDPIDGTKPYIRNAPLFSTQLALMEENELILGVSNIIDLKELMYAEKGSGAYLNGEKVEVTKTKSLKEAYGNFGSINRFDDFNKVQELINLSQKIKWLRGIGDAWSYHLLAQGKTDLMVEVRIHIWDIAALKVIVEEAGGKVTDIEGGEIKRESTNIIATNGVLHNDVLNYFK